MGTQIPYFRIQPAGHWLIDGIPFRIPNYFIEPLNTYPRRLKNV